MANSTTKGLMLVYLGEFENDPSADTVYNLAQYFNTNMAVLNGELVDLDLVQGVTGKVEISGLTDQIVFGGSY